MYTHVSHKYPTQRSTTTKYTAPFTARDDDEEEEEEVAARVEDRSREVAVALALVAFACVSAGVEEEVDTASVVVVVVVVVVAHQDEIEELEDSILVPVVPSSSTYHTHTYTRSQSIYICQHTVIQTPCSASLCVCPALNLFHFISYLSWPLHIDSSSSIHRHGRRRSSRAVFHVGVHHLHCRFRRFRFRFFIRSSLQQRIIRTHIRFMLESNIMLFPHRSTIMRQVRITIITIIPRHATSPPLFLLNKSLSLFLFVFVFLSVSITFFFDRNAFDSFSKLALRERGSTRHELVLELVTYDVLVHTRVFYRSLSCIQ